MTAQQLHLETADTLDVISNKITQHVTLVSAETAARWLERNVRNRPISSIAVERYRRDMAEGRWAYTADPIRFSAEGTLLDGQHRLDALSKVKGLSLPFTVVRGLPIESQMFMDQGRKRPAGQQLHIKGIKNASNVAAAARFYIVWQQGLLFKDSKAAQMSVTTSIIEQWVDENADLLETVSPLFTTLRSNDAPPSVSAAAAFRFTELDADHTADFFTSLAKGGTAVGNPINTLDKRLTRIRREGMKMSNRDYLAFIIQAWNASRDGRQLVKFQRPVGGSWNATNFPEPK